MMQIPKRLNLPKRSEKAGLPPGTLVYVGEEAAEPTRMTIMEFGCDQCDEFVVGDFQEIVKHRSNESMMWLNIDGLQDTVLVGRIGNEFSIHSLALEDILNPNQRAKFDDYQDHVYFVLRMFYFSEDELEIVSEQVSIIVGRDFVLSFQETPGDVFDRVRERLRTAGSRVRGHGVDYLAYALIDVIVDHYFHVTERVGDRLDYLEDELLENPTEETLRRIFIARQEIAALRKSIWPLRDAVGQLQRSDSPLLTPDTKLYLRDVYDHTVQELETIETYRDNIASMIDIYLSSLSHRMNEVMKVLTMIATIFIPLTFVAGIYGMNFEHMPELGWRYGYFAVLATMAAIAGLMLWYFRRKNWF